MSDISNVDNIMASADKLDNLSNSSEVKSALKYSGVSKQFGKEAVKYTKYASEFVDSISTTSGSVGGLIPRLQKAGGALKAFAATLTGKRPLQTPGNSSLQKHTVWPAASAMGIPPVKSNSRAK